MIGESSITLTAKALKSARTEAYPTEAAEKKRDAKRAAKAAGTEVKTKKRPKKIQDHFDDCGTSLDGLGVELEIAYYEESDTSGSDFSDDDAALYDSSHSFLFAGSEGILPDANSEAASLDEFTYLAKQNQGKGILSDVLEICGGEGKPGKCALHRHLKHGGNYDLTTGFDLNTRRDQLKVRQIVEELKPLVVIMSPVCTPFGPRAYLNRTINQETYQRSYNEAVIHGRFCGNLALLQYKSGRYFVTEHPYPSLLFDEEIWRVVLQLPDTRRTVFDQCRTGLKGHDGLLAKKPTQLISNSEELLQPFCNLRCTGNHNHSDTAGRTKALQKYTMNMAHKLIDGVVLLKRKLRSQGRICYPTNATMQSDVTEASLLTSYPTVAAGPGEVHEDEAPVSTRTPFPRHLPYMQEARMERSPATHSSCRRLQISK